jgi:hypothetical protein
MSGESGTPDGVPEDGSVTHAPLPFTGGRVPASPEELDLVARRVALQFLVAPAISFAALLGGFYLGWPRIAALGIVGFGLSGLWIGGLAILEHRLMFIRPGQRFRRERDFVIYEGIAAVPYGLTFVLGGTCLVGAATVFLAGTSLDEMRAHVLARPAFALVPVGAMLVSQGLAFVIGFVDRRGSAARRMFGMLLDAPVRLGGLILIALGALVLWVGLVDWLTPALFHAWFESTTGNPWPFGPPEG